MTPNTADDLLSVGQAADLLQIRRRTVLRRIAAGRIQATKVGEGRTSGYVITRREIDRVLTEVGVPARDGERPAS